ncbi:hypothetical protein [Blastopirellula marina]|uniref:Uncharacterized protein n=1 Tax=Blastopirellula marina DSM 3645 TaxID=314230 RepID=A3ZTN1_9BACT|nr:hypothetical protein [Blastopirellula marina]EAQ80297.1 hypothetical protein DSM3645_19913 [Blastopirellula marina DSM 3645]
MKEHIYLLLSVALLPSLLYAQPTPAESGPMIYARVSKGSGLNLLPERPGAFLKAITDADIVFGSALTKSGRFQRRLLGHGAATRQPSDLLRSVVEWSPEHRSVVSADKTGSIKIGVFDDKGFLLSNDGTWIQANAYWAMKVDGSELTGEHQIAGTPLADAGEIHFDLSSLVRRNWDFESKNVRWDGECLTFSARMANECPIRIRLRTPNDALRLGTDLSEVAMSDPQLGLCLCWNRFSLSPSEKLRAFASLPANVIEKRLGESCKIAEGEFDWRQAPLSGSEGEEQSHRFAEIIGLSTNPQYDASAELAQTYESADERLKFRLAARYPSEIWEVGNVEGFADCFEEMYGRLSWVIDERYRRRGELLGIDDEAILWQEAERVTSPIEMYQLVQRARELAAADIFARSPGQRIGFLAKLAELGHPPFDAEGGEFAQEFEDPFVEAIFRARWQWPCQTEHLTACQKIVQNYRVETIQSQVATDTLVRLDQIDMIPTLEIELWYREHVLRAPNPAHGMRMLTLLSSRKSGQAYLLNRLRKNSDPLNVTAGVRNILQARLDAVRKLKRYDFMSQEIVLELAQVLRPE